MKNKVGLWTYGVQFRLFSGHWLSKKFYPFVSQEIGGTRSFTIYKVDRKLFDLHCILVIDSSNFEDEFFYTRDYFVHKCGRVSWWVFCLSSRGFCFWWFANICEGADCWRSCWCICQNCSCPIRACQNTFAGEKGKRYCFI